MALQPVNGAGRCVALRPVHGAKTGAWCSAKASEWPCGRLWRYGRCMALRPMHNAKADEWH